MIKILNCIKYKNYSYLKSNNLNFENFLVFLVKNNLISSFYKVNQSKYYKVIPKNKKVIFSIKNFKKSNKQTKVSFVMLKYLVKQNTSSIYILNSDKGLITHLQALKCIYNFLKKFNFGKF